MSRDQMIFRRAKSGYNVYQTQRHVVDSNSVLKYLALLSIVTAPRQTNGRKGYDANTVRASLGLKSSVILANSNIPVFS